MFGDQSMTPATIDRLVHHATIAIRAGKVHRHHDHDGTDGEKTGLSPLSVGVHPLSRSRSEPAAERLVGLAVAKRQGAAFDQQVDLIGREREPRRHRLQGGSTGWP
jgi:hypothetical protein